MLALQRTDLQPANDEWDLIRIDMLTESECLAVRSVVHELMGYKLRARLGVASYKSLPLVGERVNRWLYHQRAARLNPIFRERLGWLYDRLAKNLAQALHAPTCYPDGLALPGFHVHQKTIRERGGRFRTGPTPHFDLQWQKIDWGDPKRVDFSLPLSFTLSLALPRKGSGLNTWEIRYGEYKKLDREGRDKLRASRLREYHPYKVGQMVLHSGLQLHQIAPSQEFEPGDQRITLQGHGIKRDGVWQLYW